MSLNIKNEQTVELVRELASRSGLSQTSAVEEAVRRMLAQTDPGGKRAARKAEVSTILASLDRSLTTRQKHRIRTEEAALYDADGLPS